MEDYSKETETTIHNRHDVSKDDFTIVIPVLNEEQAIKYVLDSIKLAGYENIIVVDGYSQDNTVKIVKRNGVPLYYQEGKGKTGAIITAIKKIKTPFLVIMDGDCTYDPKDIKKFFPYLKKYHQIIGKRNSGRDNIPILNRIGNDLINILFNLIFSTKLSDVCSGMYALTTDFARKIKLETSGFDVEVEIAALASMYGKIIEVPINYYERVGMQKLQPFRDGYKIITSILMLGLKHKQVRLFKLFAFASFLSIIFLCSLSFISFNNLIHIFDLIRLLISLTLSLDIR